MKFVDPLREGIAKFFYSFISPVGHNIWWENSRNGPFGPKNDPKTQIWPFLRSFLGSKFGTIPSGDYGDLEFVKKFTRPNFPVKEFYTLKTRKSRLLSPTINSKNTSLSVIWPSLVKIEQNV